MAWTYSLTYTPVNDYSVKDGLTTGDAAKVILGADIDDELSGIQSALNSKLDAGSVSSQAEAEAGTDTESVMTPQGVQYWGDANGGIVGDLRALADPNADRILFWDDSAGTATFLTVGDGLEISTTTLQLPSTVAGDGLTLTSGVLAVVGGSGITANANDIALTDAASTTSNPIDVTSGSITIDVAGLTTIEGNALAATDTFLVDDGGTPKGIEKQDMGYAVTSKGTTSSNLAASEMNTIMKYTGTATLTLPLNSTTALPIGVPVVIVNDNSSTSVTVTAAASVTLESVYHAGGTTAASDTVLPGGMAVLVKTETDVWQLAGDIADT